MLPACSKKEAPPIEEVKPAEEQIPPPPPPLEDEEEMPEVEEVETEPVVLVDIFFDYDKYNIKDMYKKDLISNAEQLMGRDDVMVMIEGHCDERGTKEYNLALGEKRAKAVRDFYTAYGVNPDILEIISYGEEKPFVKGSDEAAWAKNRRAHMMVK
jgi:peptidoglycan-associated lipoprotein